ncbi:hypothetical protein JTB14_030409 [Gonioctena quinquepunctata]|nr:hypothetical protein JTB14_030409 [Gonioctena quinquepunctata]
MERTNATTNTHQPTQSSQSGNLGLAAKLVHTAIANSKNFSKMDVIVIWLDKINSTLLETFLNEIQHTKSIIISEPYRYDIRVNQIIYKQNWDVQKNLHHMGLKNTVFMECNNILRKSNYSRNGYELKPEAAHFLCNEIFNRIKMFTTNRRDQGGIKLGTNQNNINKTREDLKTNSSIKTSSFLEVGPNQTSK